MASLGPLSSLRLSQSSSSSSSFSNPNPNPKFILPSGFRTTSLSLSSHSDQHNSSTVSEKKSNRFSVATGEFFLRIASRLIKTTWDVSDRTNGVATSVNVDDAIDREIIWEQRINNVDTEIEMDKDAYAKPKAKLPAGYSFSAAGLLFPYHLGVAQYLIEKGYITETTPLAGSSAGAIVCAVVASGSSMQEALEATKILAEDCRLRGTAFRLGAVLRDILVKFLPDDVHTRSNGRVRVAVTQVFRRPMGLLVDQFDSKEDLIDAVFTSSFIPGYLAPRPATFFRNRLCIDGGLTLFMPPTSASKTVRICAFPTDRMGLQGVGISPDCNPDNRATPQQLFKWALEPAEDHVLDKLFELGYLDAAVWGKRNPLEEVLGVNSNNASP